MFRGFNVFSSQECPETITFNVEGTYTVTIAQKSSYDLSKREVLKQFLNNSLKAIMHRLSYVSLGRAGKHFNIQNKKEIDSLVMYKGVDATFEETENGIALRVDTARKMVRVDTVMQYIDATYKQARPDATKEEKRNNVRVGLVGCIIMTSYGKPAFYRIIDVEFNKPMSEVYVSE